MTRALTIVEIIFVGLLLTGLLPDINAGSVVCFVILMGAGVVVFRQARMLVGAESLNTRSFDTPPKYVRPEGAADGIELRSNDSVEQIARSMIATSFRQASMKYHPDHGGSNDLMGRIVQARTLLQNGLGRY